MLNDVRYAFRTLIKHRGFTAVAVCTLALGIGANTAIFSVVNGVLLRPLPYPAPDKIVEVWSTTQERSKDNHAAGDYMDLHRGSRSLAALAGYREDAATIVTPGNDPVRLSSAIVTAEYFEVFGMPAAYGRTFNRAADAATSEPLVVLSDEAWRLHFRADPAVVGQRPRLNGVPHAVVGIMPAAFDYPAAARVWVLSPRPVPLPPIDVSGDLLEARDVRYFNAVARVKPDVSVSQASADLDRIVQDIARRFPETGSGRGILLEPLHQRIVGDVRDALLVLLGAVGLVLLIACANVSSLLLARASGRQREIAIRSALGAARGRIVRQLITESLLLGLTGGIAGLIAGSWAVALLVSVLPEGTPRVEHIGLDRTVAAVAIATSCVSALIFGLVPSLQASRASTSAVLRSGDRTATGDRRRTRTRSALVVAEVALTLVLLVSAGLLTNSFLRLQRVDPGFSVDQVTLVSLPLPQTKYSDGKLQAAFYQRLLEGIRQRAEIESAAILFPSPLQGNNANGGFSVEGQPAPVSRADRPRASIGSISPEYFRTLGIPIIRGRDFTDRDRDPAPAVAIVNATLANRYFPGQDPIGRRLRFGDGGDDWITVVGIAGDSRNLGLDAEPNPLVYIPYHNFPLPFMNIAARSSAGPGAVASVVREQVKQLDAELPVDRVVPLREVVSESVAQPRFRTILIAAFALMATLLAAVGVYGLISYSVTQRTREIGIRMALGANPSQVMLPVVREGLVLAVMGIALGLAGAIAATRVLSTFLFGVEATDPATFAGVALLLLFVAFIASYIPSRRALRVDPISALRAE
jgi:putative ABC transport system permease protein